MPALRFKLFFKLLKEKGPEFFLGMIWKMIILELDLFRFRLGYVNEDTGSG